MVAPSSGCLAALVFSLFHPLSPTLRVAWLLSAALSYTSQHRLQVFSLLNNHHLTQSPSLLCGSI